MVPLVHHLCFTFRMVAEWRTCTILALSWDGGAEWRLAHHFCPCGMVKAEWRTWCTIFVLFGRMVVPNGALCTILLFLRDGGAEWCLGAPFLSLWDGCAEWRTVHHFGSFSWDEEAEWRTWCTILALFRGMAALNGASITICPCRMAVSNGARGAPYLSTAG